ncbi:flagellar biosynthesis protein FlgH [Kosakonia sp. SMBL-WEM22]|uniref:PAAR domain-containing protein n=1 Tax=Kosakonia sp. SMBL-WEM22 TaxID=2725560 RepID=UPI001659FE8F|nr:PAAR domain-containing protein [Kosakonia sp. SMBL-WEM22]QNQ21267.1 flagellar biosynthesis protein FlgH [Kosakonia sp. SMBL-WEM22]
MGQPAARAQIDTSAHSGTIQTGSPDVIIGGFPAARKGDALSCSQHGNGAIVGGSGTVFVNNLPLARMGDQTQCNTSSTPIPPANKAAPTQYWGGTLAKKAGEDGLIHDEFYDARILGAYANLEDKNENGDLDTLSTGFAAEDLTMGNLKSEDLFRGEIRNKVSAVNATGSIYGGGDNIYGLNSGATATGIQYGATGRAGEKGLLYGNVSGDVNVGSAEAKAVLEFYGGNKGRYGFNADFGAEANVFKAEAVGNLDVLGILVAEAKVAGVAGSAATGAGGGIWADKNDYSLNVKITGRFAIGIGFRGDVEGKIALKPIENFIVYIYKLITSSQTEKNNSGDGTILTGCATVLIGS